MTNRTNNTNELTVNTFNKATNPTMEVLQAFGIKTANMTENEGVSIVNIIRKFLTIPAQVENTERQQDLLQMVVNVVSTMTNVTPVTTDAAMQFQLEREAVELTREQMQSEVEKTQSLANGALNRLSKEVIETMHNSMITPKEERHLTIFTNSPILNNWQLTTNITEVDSTEEY